MNSGYILMVFYCHNNSLVLYSVHFSEMQCLLLSYLYFDIASRNKASLNFKMFVLLLQILKPQKQQIKKNN